MTKQSIKNLIQSSDEDYIVDLIYNHKILIQHLTNELKEKNEMIEEFQNEIGNIKFGIMD